MESDIKSKFQEFYKFKKITKNIQFAFQTFNQIRTKRLTRQTVYVSIKDNLVSSFDIKYYL